MGATTDATAVKAVTGSTLDDAVFAPFVAASICIVDNLESCTTAKGISDDCINSAATWLAAHLFTSSGIGASSAVVTEERFEGWSVKRAVGSFSGKGIMGSPYGQAANTLLAGCLEEADKAPATIGFFG